MAFGVTVAANNNFDEEGFALTHLSGSFHGSHLHFRFASCRKRHRPHGNTSVRRGGDPIAIRRVAIAHQYDSWHAGWRNRSHRGLNGGG